MFSKTTKTTLIGAVIGGILAVALVAILNFTQTPPVQTNEMSTTKPSHGLDYEICIKFTAVEPIKREGKLLTAKITGVYPRGDTISFLWKTTEDRYFAGDYKWVTFNGSTGEPMQVSPTKTPCPITKKQQ